jgi:hypothetical protein
VSGFLLVIRCENGHQWHLRVEPGQTREWALTLAGAVDGSIFKAPSGPDSDLAKCGVCKAPITCDVIDEGAKVS